MLNDLSQSYLRSRVVYDENSGNLYWLTCNTKRTKPGEVAGYVNKHGYTVLLLDGKRYLVHRLVWLYVKGCWPNNFIDHIDRNRSNNRICNLREATRSENYQNSKKKNCGSIIQSKYKGVNWNSRRNKWAASISVNGKNKHLGSFELEKDAATAYLKAKIENHTFISKQELMDKYFFNELIGE